MSNIAGARPFGNKSKRSFMYGVVAAVALLAVGLGAVKVFSSGTDAPDSTGSTGPAGGNSSQLAAAAPTTTSTVLQANVQDVFGVYIHALSTGDGERVFAMQSSRCKLARPLSTILKAANAARDLFSTAHTQSVTSSVNGSNAVVYATYDNEKLNSSSGTYWIYENNEWRFDSC